MKLNGAQISRFLAERGKSEAWLADKLDVSVGTIKNLIHGQIPRVETLVILAELMGCKIEMLITGRR